MIQRDHAVVIGGGIGGLLAARVLTNYFSQVTILERDIYPDKPTFRPGVPQGRQVHTMLLKGQQVLEELLPGIADKLYAQGAVQQWYGHKSIYVYKGRRVVPIPPLLVGWNASRMLVEWQIRTEVQALPQVKIVQRAEVIDLLASPQQGHLRGILYRLRKKEPEDSESTPQEIEADLVVDASGASSRIISWLQALGYQAPQETVVDARIRYATQIYQQPADWREEWTGILIQASDDSHRGGILMRVEGEKWMVALSGADDERPSTNEEEYQAFARRLPHPSLSEALQHAKPLTPIYAYQRTANRWRHFKHLPDNLVILGDALCHLNPVYGQGMTVAALEARILDDCLALRTQQPFSQIFHKRVARLIRKHWLLASSGDAPSKKKPGLVSRYRDALIDLLTVDEKTLLTFLEVAHLLKPLSTLFHPSILFKLLMRKRRSLF